MIRPATVALATLPAACGGGEARAPDQAVPDGAALYAAHCQSCHEGGVSKAPHKMFLAMMAPDAILAAMTDGIMQQQAETLGNDERIAVAEYLAGRSLASAAVEHPAPRCEGAATAFDWHAPPVHAGWGGVDPGNSRFDGDAGLDAESAPRLEIAWAFAFPNAMRARSQPNLAGGAVYVGSQDGTVYALDDDTGCVRWTFRATAEVRTGITITPWRPGDDDARPIAFFGDLMARAYAVDAVTGELLWQLKLDDHPNATATATPVYHEGRVYAPVSSLEVTSAADPEYPCCTFRGSLVAIDAATGQIEWKAYTIPEPAREVGKTSVGTPVLAPSGAPVWTTPTIDAGRGLVYVGTGENYSSPAEGNSDAIIAFDLATGERRWTFQATAGDAWNMGCYGEIGPNCPEENGPDFDFGSASILAADGSLLYAGQKSGDVWALDPDTSEVVWNEKVGRGGVQAGMHFGMALAGSTLFVPVSDFPDGKTYDEPARPGLYALDAKTGETLWAQPAVDVCEGREFCHPGISAAIYAANGVVFAGGMDGMLRAHRSSDGEVVWQLDTTDAFDTVSGEVAHGGSFGGPGPIVANGAVYTNSGYGIYFHMPGNLFLKLVPAGDDETEN